MNKTTDYKQAWKSAEQGRWLANEEITELKQQRDAAVEALRVQLAANSGIIRALQGAYGRFTDNDMMPPNTALGAWLKEAEACFDLTSKLEPQTRAAIAAAEGTINQ